jgi:hypothetical protein
MCDKLRSGDMEQKEKGWKHIEISRTVGEDPVLKIDGKIFEEDVFIIPIDSKHVDNFHPPIFAYRTPMKSNERL